MPLYFGRNSFVICQDRPLDKVFGHVIRQYADAEIVEHTLEHAEIVVHRKEVWDVIGQQVLDQRGPGGDLDRI